MGKRGPKAKPTHLKVLEGTARKDRVPENEPEPEIGAPDPPDWLDDEARAEWDRMAPQLVENGLLSPVDRALFTAYCVYWSIFVTMARKIGPDKLIQPGQGGVMKESAELAVLDRAAAKVDKMAAHFGIGAAARSRINLPEKPKADTDSDFLFRGKKASQ